MLSKEKLLDVFLQNFGMLPTSLQHVAMQQLVDFILNPEADKIFILKGYAGTGKTSIVSDLVKSLGTIKAKSVCLAPTGRAAKVLSNYAQRKSYTIHKHIYSYQENAQGSSQFSLKPNKAKDTLFIVDESSMITNQANAEYADLFSSRSLLADLMQFVFEGDNCKMLLVGDMAQLPPVSYDESPALDEDFLSREFYVKIQSLVLTEVVRQESVSGILYQATKVRKKIADQDLSPKIFSSLSFPDVSRVTGETLEDVLQTAYSQYNADEIVVITRSNKRAYLFNREIRSRILGKESQIECGDYIMSVKNNYYWVDKKSEIGFIANGDMMEVRKIHHRQELYGFEFADLSVHFCDYPDTDEVDIKVILNSLSSEGASMSRTETNQLYQEVSADYADLSSKRQQYIKMKQDPYMNALQIKYGYALTCHKTQGGQWKVVFVDQSFLKPENIDKSYLRWIYTAITRATEKLYFVNFNDVFFEDENSNQDCS